MEVSGLQDVLVLFYIQLTCLSSTGPLNTKQERHDKEGTAADEETPPPDDSQGSTHGSQKINSQVSHLI